MQTHLNVAYDHNPKGAEKTIVFLHGIASSSITWERVFEIMKESPHRLIAIDLLGFGGSPKPASESYNVQTHSEWIEHTLAQVNIIGSITLVGHSMGTLIASHIAANNQLLINELILINPPILLPPESTPEGQSIRRTDMFGKLYKYLKTHKEFTLENSERVRKMTKLPEAFEITEESWIPFIKSLENTIEKQRIVPDILNYSKETKIFYGSLDGLIITDNVRSMRILPHVEVTKVPLASHAVRANMATALSQHLM